MKNLYLIETSIMNGVHKITGSTACVYSNTLAQKIKERIDEANKDCEFKTITTVTEVVLYESEHEVPVLNVPGIMPISNGTNKAKELQERLVQCCIDYINEIDDEEIQEVDFRADCLQESAIHGHWDPATDSSIELQTYVDSECGLKVREILGSYN